MANRLSQLVGVAPGLIIATVGRSPTPAGFLPCDGAAVSRTTFSALYDVLCPVLGTFTVTIASPGVLTLAGHDLADGERVRLITTGALPTGLVANTDYFVRDSSTDTFRLAATLGGAAINTTGTQSGTHTLQAFTHGAGNGTTTFNVPDFRGRGLIGLGLGSGLTGRRLGETGGAETHVLAESEMPLHGHPFRASYTLTGSSDASTQTTGGFPTKTTSASTQAAYTGTPSNTQGQQIGGTGGGSAHNNMQPFAAVRYLIKT